MAATQAFQVLKYSLSSAPVLAFPKFSKPFIIEKDASNGGIGSILMHDGHPLAFLSKTLGPRWSKLSVYENELLIVVTVVHKYEQYLTGQQFTIKTDKKV